MISKRRLLENLPYLAVIWVLPLAVYLKTLPPSILYIDSGTMLAAAYSLGIPNPPGFPTYIMLAHLFTKLPFGTVLGRLEFLSVLSAIGTLTLVYCLVQKIILADFWCVRGAEDDSRILGRYLSRGITLKSVPPYLVRLISLSATLVLAFSYQFWSQTLNTESYIFTNLLMISLLAIILTINKETKTLTKRFIAGAALLGVATGANPTIAQTIPALLLGVFFYRRRLDLKSLLLGGVVAVFLTVLVYSYLPLRASQHPFLNWGDPQTPKLFLGHLHGEGLNIYDPRTNSINGFTGRPEIFAQSVGRYLYLFLIQFTPVLLPLILIGAVYICKKNRRLALLLLSVPLVNMIFGGLYLSGNQESWFISSYVIASLFFGFGAYIAIKLLLSLWPKYRKVWLVLLVVVTLGPLLWWFSKLDRSGHFVTSEYQDNLYSHLLPGAVLIGTGDFFNSMSNYEYVVTKKRPDVFPIVANMWYILPWYRDNLRHNRPDLMPKELDGMIHMSRLEEYNEVMNWYIKWLIDHGHPVYVTPMVFRETVLAGTNAGRYVPDTSILRVVPDGLAYRLLTANDILQPSEDVFSYHFQKNDFYKAPPFYLERNYKAGYHLLLREYGLSYLSMADYFLKAKNGQKEEEYLNRAYEIAPFDPEVVNHLAISTVSKGNLQRAIEYFKDALALDPAGGDIRVNLAKAYEAVGQLKEAKAELQQVLNLAEIDPQIKDDAQSELGKVTLAEIQATIPQDWKSFTVRNQGFSFRYPKTWNVTPQNGMVVLSSPDGGFYISMFGGKKSSSVKPADWVRDFSPIKFSGQQVNSGLAQIPGFDATAADWLENDGKKALEFTLSQGNHLIHLKVKPSDSPQMKNLDLLFSSLKFEEIP